MKVFEGGKRAAVSLTYDDALDGHWRQVAPRLERSGLRATFNVFPHEKCMAAVDRWRQVAAAGHELGNHSLFHPCRKEPADRFGWLPDDFDLRHYTAHRWREEMRVAGTLLSLIDGRTRRTFANTCCDTRIGTGDAAVDLGPIIAEMFVAGRGPMNEQVIDPARADLGGLGHFDGDGKTLEQLRETVERAVEAGGWAVFMFHGVGGAEHRLHIDPAEHDRLVDYLASVRDTVWTAPMVEVAERLRGGAV